MSHSVMRQLLSIALLVLGLAATVRGEVSLPAIFGDHMVLQASAKVPVWGQAAPGEKVTVSVAGKTACATAGTNGGWRVTLNLRKADAGPHTLVVTGSNRIEIQDVLVGEVWICSGQSNMQWGLSQSDGGEEAIATAQFPRIRLFTVPNVTARTPQSNCGGQWAVCSPATVAGFSAVGFYFGREVHRARKTPVGLINASWGGTPAEAWTSGSALSAALPEFKAAVESLERPTAEQTLAVTNYLRQAAVRQQALEKLFDMEDDMTGAAKTAAADYDDTGWKTMRMPNTWESQGLKEFDGMVWFRKTITVPAAWAGKDLVLRLGPIDEVDNTWFNGTLVGGKGRSRTGEVSYWNVPRAYKVPGALVKAGANVVAVRVFDTFGAGGLVGEPPEAMYATLADGSDATRLPLAGDWRYSAAFELPVIPPDPRAVQAGIVGAIYNGMIHPLIPYAMRGAIWYQGESNAGNARQYRTLLPTLINDWRTRSGEGPFPFLVVQLANYMARNPAPEASQWAELREAQALTAATVPNVGLAVTIDIGDANDIHPRNKLEVGRRLALAARTIAYGERITASGPTFKRMKVKQGRALLSFDNADGGLVAKGDPIEGFAICGADKKYVWAQAKIEKSAVVVWSDTVPEPVAVRYAWANNPACNLYNRAGLPAVPFRTDRD